MGQQQLLLVILVTIIVGIATVVAINIFGTAADQANRDAVRQDLMAAGVQAQAIWSRPALMNGANRNFSDGITQNSILYRLNIPGNMADDSSQVVNENGTYSVAVNDTASVTITGEPASGGSNLEALVNRDEDGDWQISITESSGS